MAPYRFPVSSTSKRLAVAILRKTMKTVRTAPVRRTLEVTIAEIEALPETEEA